MKKVFAILLACLVLFMNVGFTINNHYCGGELASSSLTFGHGDVGCGMEDESTPCEKPSHESTFQKKGCCENEFLEFQIDDDYNKTVVENVNINFKFVAAFVTTFINNYSFDTSTEVEYLSYSPPLLNLDIPVLIQSFLI